MDLLPHHKAMLEASAISDEVIKARGYRSVKTAAELKRLGFGASQLSVPTLLVPIWGVHGEIALRHHRPDEPRQKNGKIVKYEFPFGSSMAIDVHPFIQEQIKDPAVPLWITEGAKKADSAITLGLCCIALIGVWNWRGKNEYFGKTALPDWDSIALKDGNDQPRDVNICFDSDAMHKKEVHSAVDRLGAFLKQRGARVHYVYLPHGQFGRKIGLDDFITEGHGIDDLLALAESQLRPLPPSQETVKTCEYEMTDEGTFHNRQTREGTIPSRLANFIAKIVGDIIEDDGITIRRALEIESRFRGESKRFTVPVSGFPSMNWVNEQLGPLASISAGMGAKDRFREAIQLLSDEPAVTRVYSHLGWRQMDDGKWAYLHAGGAIGADGPLDVQVRLFGPLERFRLPEPPAGDEAKEAVLASLDLLTLADIRIMAPLLATVYRACLGTTDFTLFLVGPTGSLKSELSALAQQHYGPEMSRLKLPGNWSSTANSLEDLACRAKDALLTVDDFAPVGSSREVESLHAKADRLIRAQANNSGRQRLNADANQKEPRPPRGTLMSSGEDVPGGTSLRPRMLIVELNRRSVSKKKLTVCQQLAREGSYARSMAAFLVWVAKHYDRVQEELEQRRTSLRSQILQGSLHLRTPELVANLGAGMQIFLRFAASSSFITTEQEQQIWTEVWTRLMEAGRAQTAYQLGAESANRYIQLLIAAISSGKAHVASMEGDAPLDAGAWGWRPHEVTSSGYTNTEWRPQGTRIGWVDGDDVFLQPDASFQCAQAACSGADGIKIGISTLHKRLHEKGYLQEVDKNREVLTVRRTVGGKRTEVLYLDAAAFESEEPDQPDQFDEDADPAGQFGRVFDKQEESAVV